MRFQKSVLLYAFGFVLAVFLFSPILPSANAQLDECSCANSLQDTCADGFRVSYLGRVNNTFRYEVCNDPGACGVPPMALSHADIVITDSICIPDDAISTIMIGTDGQTQTACDDPNDKDNSCGVNGLVNQLLIKCDETDGIFEPTNPGQCITIEMTIDNADGIGIMEGPSLALNKAGRECGQGCLLGPTCGEACVPPQNPCEVTVVKEIMGTPAGVDFNFNVAFGANPPDDFMFTLNPPGTPSATFQIPGDNTATITELVPPGWTLESESCNNANFCTTDANGGITCRCPSVGGEIATCTFTNSPPVDPPTCNIQIVKETDPDGSMQSFDFTSTQGPANFSLQDGGTENIMNIPLNTLVVVQETLPDNWVLDNIVCEGGDQGQFVIAADTDQLVRITCDDSTDDPRVCTFMNRFIPDPPPTGCCLDGDVCTNNVLSGECGGTFEEGGTCGEGLCVVDPRGCCVEDNVCSPSVLESECNGTFDQETACGEGLCTITPVEPIGCCLDDDVCSDSVLEGDCSGTFSADTNCGEGDCIVPDGGCCFLNGEAEAALASRQVDPEKCVDTTMAMCDEFGGMFQGVGTMCTQFPDECNVSPIEPTDVPTLGQWGMIVIAAFLGIYGLIVLRKRSKYNAS